jgi:hypothetical protein
LAVTTATDLGVSTPVILAGVGGAGVLAAEPPPLHPHNDPADTKNKSTHVSVFISRSPG